MPSATHHSWIEDYISMGRCRVIVSFNIGAIFFRFASVNSLALIFNVHHPRRDTASTEMDLQSFFSWGGLYFIHQCCNCNVQMQPFINAAAMEGKAIFNNMQTWLEKISGMFKRVWCAAFGTGSHCRWFVCQSALIPLQPVITCIDTALQKLSNNYSLTLSSSGHFSAFHSTNSLSAASDVFASGCCQWLLTERHRAPAKRTRRTSGLLFNHPLDYSRQYNRYNGDGLYHVDIP